MTRLVAGGMALLALCITVFSVCLTLLLHWDGPFRDLWEFVDDIERQFNGEWSMDYLLEAYGGAHRIFLPKLVFYADAAWLGERNYLTVALALACQSAYGWLIARAIRQSTLPAAQGIILAACFAIALFSTSQINNFLYAMDVQWYLSNLAGIVSLWALAQAAARRAWLLVWGAGTIAALCNFTGLMALPVAALVLLLDHARQPSAHGRRLLWLLPIISVCLWYVHHTNNSRQVVFVALERSEDWRTSLYIVWQTLHNMLPYMLKYLASPLSRTWPVSGSILSAGGLLLLVYYWYRHYQDRLSAWQKLCLYIATYIAASAFFTAFGRLIYPNSATTERYQTLVLPWMPALAGLLWPDLYRHRFAPLFLTLWLTLFLCHMLPTQLSSARDMAILSNRVNLAHTAARAGVLELPYIAATLSHPLIRNNINAVKDNDAFLRSHQLGYFRYLPHYTPGTVLDTSLLPPCQGSAGIQRNEQAGAWIIEGQLLAGDQPLRDILVLHNRTVVGLGLLIRPEGFFGPLTAQAATNSRFRAFATTTALPAGATVILAGLDRDRPVCALPALSLP